MLFSIFFRIRLGGGGWALGQKDWPAWSGPFLNGLDQAFPNGLDWVCQVKQPMIRSSRSLCIGSRGSQPLHSLQQHCGPCQIVWRGQGIFTLLAPIDRDRRTSDPSRIQHIFVGYFYDNNPKGTCTRFLPIRRIKY